MLRDCRVRSVGEAEFLDAAFGRPLGHLFERGPGKEPLEDRFCHLLPRQFAPERTADEAAATARDRHRRGFFVLSRE